MKGFILDERTRLEEVLKGNINEDNPYQSVSLLMRYKFSEGKDKKLVYEEVEDYLTKNYKNYNKVSWMNILEEMVGAVKSRKNGYDIFNIEEVIITEAEWESIIALEDKQLEKLAFTILVYQKVYEKFSPLSDGWITNEKLDILQEAIGNRKKENLILYNKLYRLGYLDIKKSVDTKSFRVLYRNKDSKPKIVINDFDKIIHYYNETRLGWKYIKCGNIKEDGTICNKWERVPKYGKNPLYCKACSKKIEKEKTAKRVEKYRKSKM